MTNRTLSTRAVRAMALVPVLTLLAGVMPVHAASSIGIEARALVGGRYEVSGWAAVAVTLVNEGAPTEGNLSAETRTGTVQRFVEMPAGARKVVMLYVQPEAFQRRITVRYEEPNGRVEAVVEVRVLEQSGSQLAIVGDVGGALRPQLAGGGDAGSPEPIVLAAADIPERPEPLDGISGIVWAADSSALSEAQRRSLERWVAEGGQLVVIGGPDWQSRTAAFTDLLPVTTLTALDGVPQGSLAAWSGSETPAEATTTVSSGTLRDDARALVTADDGTVLVSMRSVGAGRAILIGSDMATDAYRGWEGSPQLWTRLLPTAAAFEQFFGGGFPIAEEAVNSMSQALGNLPSLEIPPAELLLGVIVGYILLIGPISYLVLRRLDRREMAWVTAPLLVILFTACSYGIGSTLKGGEVIVNQIALIRSSGTGGAATVESYAGIFSPERTTYDVRVNADALIAPVRSTAFPGGPANAQPVTVEQGDPAQLHDLAIGVFGFEAVRADAIADYEPALSVRWRWEDGHLIGTVTNSGEMAIEDVAYISNGGGEKVGNLGPGEQGEFTVSHTNFNGSSASDQVYGFGGFEPTEAQRGMLMRRQVIDALVGYGQFMPGGVDVPTAGDPGPFVIGWLPEYEGPVPVEVEGLTAQRYAQSVEVISVRPELGTGEMTLRPGQMSVSIIGTDGDAQSGGPGMVFLGEGSVTFSISLPLEAAGMAVSELAILVGPDPSIVLQDPGGFGGFWPPGFTAEVRDTATGEWMPLGDISQRSRFEIDDPATVLSSTGRIEVRISGGEIDPNFGQASVWVGAEASGVIGE